MQPLISGPEANATRDMSSPVLKCLARRLEDHGIFLSDRKLATLIEIQRRSIVFGLGFHLSLDC